MKFMIPLLMAVLPAASLAQSQSGTASGVPSIAIPKTTEVIVIETPRQGVTPQQVMAVIPEEIKATVKLYLDGKIRQWYSRGDGKGVVMGLHHFGFWVEDADETKRRLLEAEATLFRERPQNATTSFFEEKWVAPDGVQFDITEHGWAGARPPHED